MSALIKLFNSSARYFSFKSFLNGHSQGFIHGFGIPLPKTHFKNKSITPYNTFMMIDYDRYKYRLKPHMMNKETHKTGVYIFQNDKDDGGVFFHGVPDVYETGYILNNNIYDGEEMPYVRDLYKSDQSRKSLFDHLNIDQQMAAMDMYGKYLLTSSLDQDDEHHPLAKWVHRNEKKLMKMKMIDVYKIYVHGVY